MSNGVCTVMQLQSSGDPCCFVSVTSRVQISAWALTILTDLWDSSVSPIKVVMLY